MSAHTPRIADDRTALLADAHDRSPTVSEVTNPADSASSISSPPLSRKSILHIAAAIGSVCLFDTVNEFQDIPLNQVVEDIICRQMYGRNLPMGGCGEDKDVQAELAFLCGWLLTLDLLPGIITAIPYGYVADRYGRKTGLALSMLGMAIGNFVYIGVCWWPEVFPIRMIWASPLCMFLGGGPVVLNGIIYSMLAELATETYRSNAFSYLSAAVLSESLISTAIVPTIMQRNLWLPIYIGTAVLVPVAFLLSVLPDSRPTQHSTRKAREDPTERDEDRGLLDNDENNEGINDSDNDASRDDNNGNQKAIRVRIAEAASSLSRSVKFFVQGNKQVTLLLTTLVTTTLGKHSQDILLQFARSRYGWSWAQAGYLMTIKALVLLILLLGLLPLATYLFGLLSRQTPPPQRDLWLARASCGLLIVGAMTIGLSTQAATMIGGLVVYGLGNAYNILVRSLLAAMVASTHLSLMFNTAGILESVGAIVAGPLLASAFRKGLVLGDIWIGLPFFVAALLFSLAMLILVAVWLPTPVAGHADTEEEVS